MASQTKLVALDLYKSIRRLHRHLPPAMRSLGNTYVTGEFRRHASAEPQYLPPFISSWQAYHDDLAAQLLTRQFGKPMLPEQVTRMREEQVGQLFELYQGIKGIGKDGGGEGIAGTARGS
ncbi:ACN9-domain-containing protein [Cladochytrium replicatum]|nr:ACN9-domain-containing protein [Cladochytrium replicatum]